MPDYKPTIAVVAYYVATIFIMFTLVLLLVQQSTEIKHLRACIDSKNETIDEYASINLKLIEAIKLMQEENYGR